jgi:hypothetical protein
MKRFWPVLLLALLPLIPLWRCVFLGEAIGPFDQIQQMAPWNGPKPTQPWDVLQADAVLQFYPWRDLVLKSWGQGEVPLWNPYELAGYPLLANSQSAALYPPHILLGLLRVPTVPAMTLLAWFHLFWAGLGTYFLARRFGTTSEGAAIGGASFQLSAFMLSWTGLPSVISTVSWIPWMLAFVLTMFGGRLIAHGGTDRASESVSRGSRAAIRAFCGAAVCCGMMIFAGHLQFVAYGVLAAAIFSIALAIQIRVWKPLIASALALSLGFAVAAPQLLPVLYYSQDSHRKNTPTPEGYAAYNSGGIQPFELLGVVYPQLLGYPERGIKIEGVPAELPGFWPAYTKQGSNYAEVAIGIGPLVLFLLLAVRKRDLAAASPLIAVGLFGFLLAVGAPVNWFLYNFVPGWSSTGSPGRAEVLFLLAACVAASMAVDQRTAVETDRRKRGLPVLWLAIATLLSFGLVAQVPKMLAMLGGTADISSVAMDAARYPIIVCAVAATLVGLAGWQWLKAGRTTSQWLFGALVLTAVIAPSFNVRTGHPNLATSGPKDERIAVINDGWGLQAAAQAVLPPNTASVSRIHELGGYDSLLHRDTVALLNDISGGDPAPAANGNMMFIKPQADPQKLAQAGVTEVWSRLPLEGYGEATSSEGGVFKYKLEGPGRVSTPQGRGTILSESLTSLTVRATGPGPLVVRDRFMRGWRLAWVDGLKVHVPRKIWREIELTAGEHTVEFRYFDTGFLAGFTFAAPAWVLILALGAASLGRPRAEAS